MKKLEEKIEEIIFFETRVELITSKKQKVKRNQINSPKIVIEMLREIGLHNSDRETMVVIGVNVKNQINGVSLVSIGTIDSSLIHPREIYKFAFLRNCSNIIIAHNHPSGNVTPSEADRNITKRLCESGKILGIPVLDHIIVGFETERYYSFKEHCLL